MKKMLSITMALILTFACSLTAFAIDFDVEKVFESIVVVYAGSSVGSGFAIGIDCIITNAHVIDRAQIISLGVYNDQVYQGELLVMDNTLDLAVLRIKNKKMPVLKMGDYLDLPIGSDVYAIGAPKNMPYTLTKGVLSAKERILGGLTYIQTDASINVGNSGGPLLNESGKVIGINSLKLIDSEGIGLAIPINVVTQFLEDAGIEFNEQGEIIGKFAFQSSAVTDGHFNHDVALNEKIISIVRQETFYLKVAIIVMIIFQFILMFVVLFKKKMFPKTAADHMYVNKCDFEIEIEGEDNKEIRLY